MFIESYTSLNASALPQSASQSKSRAEQAAKDFEAMFTSMMFKSMRGAISSENSLIPKNMGEEMFTEMLDGEYAKMSSEKGNIGLAALILKEIERSEGKSDPSSDLPAQSARRRLFSSKPYSSADSAALVNRVRKNWEHIINDASAKYGIDPNLVTAVIARESAGNPHAISNKGAKGLMQLMDGTAREMGVKYSFSPAENIDGGVKYLRNMLNMFGGDETLALASYNAGPGAVRRFGGIPPYRETQEYVKAVMTLRDKAAEPAAQNIDDNNAQNNIASTVNAEVY